jgi:hypothetical protein
MGREVTVYDLEGKAIGKVDLPACFQVRFDRTSSGVL